MGRPACLLRRFPAIPALYLASATLAWAEAKTVYVDHAAAGA